LVTAHLQNVLWDFGLCNDPSNSRELKNERGKKLGGCGGLDFSFKDFIQVVVVEFGKRVDPSQ